MAEATNSTSAPARGCSANRHYTPEEAAYAAAQYLNFDPSFFLQEAALAGMELLTNGRLIHHYEDEKLKTNTDLCAFLWCWLKAGKGGKALRELMLQRGLVLS